MLAVMSEVDSEVAEREEVIHYIAITLMTRKNLFILGDRGQAKSYAINLFRQRIDGARQFERLISKQMDEEMLFGRLDLSSLIPGSVSTAMLDAVPEYQDAVLSGIKHELAVEILNQYRLYEIEDYLDGLTPKLTEHQKKLVLSAYALSWRVFSRNTGETAFNKITTRTGNLPGG